MKNNSKLLVSLLCVGMMTLAGCQNDDFIEKANPQRAAQKGATGDTWSLSIEATKGGSADTRLLELESGNLNGTWAVNEQIGVYLKGVKLGVFKVTKLIEGTNGKSATIYGTGLSDEGIVEGSNVLTLIYPDNETNPWSYTGQDGTLTSISSNYDFMLATLTVNKSGSDITVDAQSTDLQFETQQSIYRFGFKNGSDAINVKEFTISSAANEIMQEFALDTDDKWISTYGSLTVKPTSATTDLLYVSIFNALAGTGSANTDTYNFTVVDDNNALYMGTQAIGEEFLADRNQFNSFQEVKPGKATIDKKTSESSDVW